MPTEPARITSEKDTALIGKFPPTSHLESIFGIDSPRPFKTRRLSPPPIHQPPTQHWPDQQDSPPHHHPLKTPNSPTHLLKTPNSPTHLLKTPNSPTHLLKTPNSPINCPATPISTKRLHHAWPNDIIQVIRQIVNQKSTTPAAPEFVFELTEEAANKNFCILSKYGKDLHKAIVAQQESPVGYGSEFRPTDVLETLFQHHPNWNRLKNILNYGSQWPLQPITDEDRAADVNEALSFGNHKGASNNKELLRSLVAKDVMLGYSLPLPLGKIHRIPHIHLAPLNIVQQETIDEEGNMTEKFRLTHDQSYKWSTSQTSVNSRVEKNELLPCRFGGCFRRLINYAVTARSKYPTSRILASKIDFKSAYRRCHLHGDTALTTATQLPDENLATIALRLTFGGAPSPYEWSVISEATCDLANAILHEEDWNPTELFSPIQHMVLKPVLLDDDIPFKKALPLIVTPPINDKGQQDMYLDDLVGLTIDVQGTNNATRLSRAGLLVIYTIARPLAKIEPIPREDMVTLGKLIAEARLEEIKTILGWTCDFRRMQVSLPSRKAIAWTNAIESMINSKSTTAENLETTIGRLVHLSMTIPFIHHFLSRIRDLFSRSKKKRLTPIPQIVINDFELMIYFIKKAQEGISMNLLSFRTPTHLYRADACPTGLGGYSLQGHAWRLKLDDNLLFRASNNLLEHIASIISPWIDIINHRLKTEDCSLSMTDNTTSEGWLRKTNFKEDNDDTSSNLQATIRIEVARLHAKHFTENQIKEYSQWFPGSENNVADALSRRFDLSDLELTQFLFSHFPDQVPDNFNIAPLPKEIASWLTSLLLRLPVNEQWKEEHTKTKNEPGRDGQITAPKLDSRTIYSSPTYLETTESESSAPSPWLYANESIRQKLIDPWLQEQSKIPSTLWFRPSGRMGMETQQKTTTTRLDSFYNDNTEDSRTMTPKRNNRRPSPTASYRQSPSTNLPKQESPYPNLLSQAGSSHADLASTSKYQSHNNGEQNFSPSETSHSKKMVTSSTTPHHSYHHLTASQ